MQLILVESPTKARTFNKYLKGDKYRVEATMGHMRDLPKSKLGIDPKSRYKPEYVEVEEKKEAIEKIEKLAKKSKSIILATDADREGEAISYHVAYLLGYVEEKWPKATLIDGKKLKRIVFHEITKSAIEKALLTPQELNLDLVDSQQARRILDRIVGYKVSPLLWKKMGKRWLSAGRVQTVALRFIVEREKEIEKFKRQAYYKVFGNFKVSSHEIEAKLVSKEGKTYEAKQKLELFDGDYTYTKTTITALNSKVIKEDLSTDSYTVHDVKSSTSKRTPPPPYTTSTLQQDASRRLGYSSKYTMSLAQKLYERGFITYHRTDSVSMSGGFVSSTRKFIKDTYTENYLSEETRRYKTKSKLAQEAHEAIRPTDVRRDIVKKKGLRGAHLKLYKLIFNRAVATQMAPAEILTIKIQILSRKKYLFETSFQSITFNGYLRLYGKKSEKSKHAKPGIGDTAKLIDLNFEEAETLPPPRYNEASLIKTLEDKGIGRPSTYAPTISTIQTRNYVEKNEGRFNPSVLGTAVSDYLVSAFPKLFAIDYTARMEDTLDQIAEGKADMIQMLGEVYKPLVKTVEVETGKKGYINVHTKTKEKCPECKKALLLRFSRHGKFYGCSGYPDCKYTRNFVEKVDKKCPKCSGDVVIKYTKRRRKFYGCSNYPKCEFAAWRKDQITTEYAKMRDEKKGKKSD